MDSLGFLMPVTYFLGILRGVIRQNPHRCESPERGALKVLLRTLEAYYQFHIISLIIPCAVSGLEN
jgi:hypothetical protein